MAYTKYRESDHVRWIGVRPAHDGEQVLAHAAANNSTVVIYTVPVGKVLLITEALLILDSDVTGKSTIRIHDVAGVIKRTVCVARHTAGSKIWEKDHFTQYPPLEIVTNETVRVSSTAVLLQCVANISGILIDA